MQVIFLSDQQQQVLAVLGGQADVAFVRSDQPSVLAAADIISLDDIKILSPVSSHALIHPCVRPAIHPFARLSIHLSIWPSVRH